MEFKYRDLYGNHFGTTTAEDTAPEPGDLEVLANEEQAAVSARVDHKGMLTWLGVAVLFIVLLQIGGK